MARSPSSSAKILCTFVLDRFSSPSVLTRRGYASAGAVNNMLSGSAERKTTVNKASWVPDPITGYYLPENQVHLDRDAAQILFKNIDAAVADDVARRNN